MSSILQSWVEELPLMMQGTLMTGVRGNDSMHAPVLKLLVRWIRSILLVQGNPESDFMEVDVLPNTVEFEHELEYMPVHYYRHLIHTLEIIGYKHPDYDTANIAMDYYLRLVNWCHLAPESHDELDERLSGDPGTTGTAKKWPGITGIIPSRKKSPKPPKPIDSGKKVAPPIHSGWGGNGY